MVDPKEGQSDALWYLENVRVRDAKLPGQKGQVAGNSDLVTGCASGGSYSVLLGADGSIQQTSSGCG